MATSTLRFLRINVVLTCFMVGAAASADETCMSPYMAKIVGQEDFVYIWTLGMPGVGDDLQDHINGPLIYKVTQPFTANDAANNPLRRVATGLRYMWQRKGYLAMGASFAGGFIRACKAGAAKARGREHVDVLVGEAGGGASLGDLLDAFRLEARLLEQLAPRRLQRGVIGLRVSHEARGDLQGAAAHGDPGLLHEDELVGVRERHDHDHVVTPDPVHVLPRALAL